MKNNGMKVVQRLGRWGVGLGCIPSHGTDGGHLRVAEVDIGALRLTIDWRTVPNEWGLIAAKAIEAAGVPMPVEAWWWVTDFTGHRGGRGRAFSLNKIARQGDTAADAAAEAVKAGLLWAQHKVDTARAELASAERTLANVQVGAERLTKQIDELRALTAIEPVA